MTARSGAGHGAGLAGDTPETLAARVLEQEHRLYPAVLRRFAAGDRRPVMLTERASPFHSRRFAYTGSERPTDAKKHHL